MLTVVTQPTVEPVTLAEVKAHCRVAIDDDDAELARFAIAAREYAEQQTDRSIMPTTWEWTFDFFPSYPRSYLVGMRHGIIPPRQPLLSVESISYLDSAGALVAWDAANYFIRPGTPGKISPEPGRYWPTVYSPYQPFPGDADLDAVAIRFVAGWADADSVPATMKIAILMLAAHWYDNRAAVAEPMVGAGLSEVPLAVKSLLDMHKWGRYA